MHNAGHAILLVKGLISDQYKLWVQTCQLSRISRVAHEFEHHLTVSRKYCQISRMYSFMLVPTRSTIINFNHHQFQPWT